MKTYKELPQMSLDDLWLIESADDCPIAIDYKPIHGGFVPAIPYYLMERFTEPGQVVYDPMAGAMVTQRVGEAMGRCVISVDLVKHGDDSMYDKLFIADARTFDPGPVDMVIWHPPYRDVIKFSDHPDDLSGWDDELRYWDDGICRCVDAIDAFLKPKHCCAIVIGNIYKKGNVIPLPVQMYTQIFLRTDWKLRGWVTKNIKNNRQGKDGLWRYRAHKAGSFVFRHEEILVYYKP